MLEKVNGHSVHDVFSTWHMTELFTFYIVLYSLLLSILFKAPNILVLHMHPSSQYHTYNKHP